METKPTVALHTKNEKISESRTNHIQFRHSSLHNHSRRHTSTLALCIVYSNKGKHRHHTPYRDLGKIIADE